MPAYVIAEIEVTDTAVYDEYRKGVPATIEKYGGRFVVRGGEIKVLEGDGAPKRQIILEFPDMDTLMRWYDSEDYAPLLEMRKRAANSSVWAVEGV
jgi:uncharacterized protein (DUF1330 family)